MKTRNIFTLLFGLTLLVFTSCQDDNEPKDWTETVTINVSAETVMYTPILSTIPIEGMNIKETTETHWISTYFSSIAGFTYERGYDYLLKVEKTHLVNPPADASNVSYKLIEILSKVKQTK
jgi:hypothetical protein